MLERIFPSYMLSRQRKIAEFAGLQKFTKMVEALPNWVDEEDEWTTITDLTQGKKSYSEDDLKSLREKANQIYYTNPSARGLIETMILFILGRNASVQAEDEKAQDYWNNWAKATKWDKRSREIIKRTLRDGEVFIRFFEPKRKGLQTNIANENNYGTIRFIDCDEIKDWVPNRHSFGIETDPDDVETPLKYYRVFFKNGVENHDEIDAYDIIHEKILVDSNVKRGVSWFVGIAKWLKKYELFLEDRCIVNRLASMFNLLIKPQGIMPASFKSKFQDESTTATGKTPSKKIPKRGSVIVAQGVDYEFLTPDVKAADTQKDGRAIERMICKTTQLVEGVVTGDYSNQNYASSLVAESPMVRMVESWQDFFDLLFQDIFAKIISRAKKRGQLGNEVSQECACNFATITHRELDKDTAAYQMHRQNKWASDKTISTKLGYDYDAEQQQIKKEEEEADKQAAKYTGD